MEKNESDSIKKSSVNINDIYIKEALAKSKKNEPYELELRLVGMISEEDYRNHNHPPINELSIAPSDGTEYPASPPPEGIDMHLKIPVEETAAPNTQSDDPSSEVKDTPQVLCEMGSLEDFLNAPIHYEISEAEIETKQQPEAVENSKSEECSKLPIEPPGRIKNNAFNPSEIKEIVLTVKNRATEQIKKLDELTSQIENSVDVSDLNMDVSDQIIDSEDAIKMVQNIEEEISKRLENVDKVIVLVENYIEVVNDLQYLKDEIIDKYLKNY